MIRTKLFTGRDSEPVHLILQFKTMNRCQISIVPRHKNLEDETIESSSEKTTSNNVDNSKQHKNNVYKKIL